MIGVLRQLLYYQPLPYFLLEIIQQDVFFCRFCAEVRSIMQMVQLLLYQTVLGMVLYFQARIYFDLVEIYSKCSNQIFMPHNLEIKRGKTLLLV